METSTSLDHFEAECYRANEIENFDTCCIKMKTQNGVKLFFAATHAAEKERNPEFVYTFEKAKVLENKTASELLGVEVKSGEIVEIDDGLKPCCFYVKFGDSKYLPHWDYNRARENQYRGGDDT